MKEDIDEILGTQESKEVTTVDRDIDSYSHEKTLKTIATIVLVCGIIATIILFVTITFPEQERNSYATERSFSLTGFLITALTCISSITTWAALNVLGNISINLFKIKDILKSKQAKNN
jgi:hypothetical protein